MRKKKNPALFDLVLRDRQIAAWLSKQHRRAAIVEGALAFCIAAGPGSDAFASMFLPPEARASTKNGHAKPAAATASPAKTLPPPGNAMGDFK